MNLTDYSPVLLFGTPWKHQKTFRFSDVFRGYRKATSGCNGLSELMNFYSPWNHQKTKGLISTSNHIFGRAIWDKLLQCIFENFQKSLGWFIPKIARAKHVVTGQSHQTNKHFVLKLKSFISGQLEINERAITKQLR